MSLALIDGAEHQLVLPPLFYSAGTYSAAYSNNGRYGGWTYQTAGVPIQWAIPAAMQDTEVWVGAALNHQSPMGSEATPIINIYGDGATTTHLTVYVTSTGALTVYRGTKAGTLLGTSAAGVIAAATWGYIELHAIIDNAAGEFELRVDGVNVLSAAAIDTQNGGTATVTVFAFNRSNAASNFSFIDDVYCVTGDGSGASGFQSEITIEGIKPNGAGNYTQLTPTGSATNWQNVDELPFSSVDYNSSSTPGQKDTYTYGNLTATTGTIIGSVIHFAALKNAAGFIKGRRVIRISGTDYNGADTPSLSGTVRYFSEILATSPATAAAWTISEVNALEAGFEVRSA